MAYRLHFANYKDDELLVMLCRLVKKKHKDFAKIEGGANSLYARIAVRRLGRGRGREGYGNARDDITSKIEKATNTAPGLVACMVSADDPSAAASLEKVEKTKLLL